MWRAIRLVIDTGVHEKRWSRDQMVEYFHRYTAMDEPNVQSEVDRYIAWPGQALAYKLGQLEILRLREEARQKLGAKFDLRAFHDKWSAAARCRWVSCIPRLRAGSARRKRAPDTLQLQAILRLSLAARGAEENSTRLRPDCLARYKA